MIRKAISYCSFLLSFPTFLAGIIIIIIKYKRGTGKLSKEKIWRNSKRLTMEKLVKENNLERYPILYFDSNGNRSLYKYNYQTLLANSSKQCKKDYKKCGILDTMGNIMCIPEEDICPINEVKIDLESNNISYTEQGYNFTYIENLTDGYVLYYKNNETNNSIIIDIKYNEDIPKYINTDSFVLDQEEYDAYESLKWGDDDDDYDSNDYDPNDYYMTNKSFIFPNNKGRKRNVLRKLELNINDSEVYDYLKEDMKGDWNIDKSYQNISMNIYKGNYIGFLDSSNMQQYNLPDFYEFDNINFPNYTAYVFSIIGIIINALSLLATSGDLLFFSVCFGIYQFPFSIGYLSYFIIKGNDVYGTIDKFMEIKADPF